MVWDLEKVMVVRVIAGMRDMVGEDLKRWRGRNRVIERATGRSTVTMTVRRISGKEMLCPAERVRRARRWKPNRWDT